MSPSSSAETWIFKLQSASHELLFSNWSVQCRYDLLKSSWKVETRWGSVMFTACKGENCKQSNQIIAINWPKNHTIKEKIVINENMATKLTPVMQIETSSQIPVFLSLGCPKRKNWGNYECCKLLQVWSARKKCCSKQSFWFVVKVQKQL